MAGMMIMISESYSAAQAAQRLKICESTLMKISADIGITKHDKRIYFPIKALDAYLFRNTTYPTRRGAVSYHNDELLRNEDAINIFKITFLTLHNWIHNKKIRFPRINVTRGLRRYSRRDLELFVDRNVIYDD